MCASGVHHRRCRRAAAERRSRFLLRGILTGMCEEVIGADELDAVQACRVTTGRDGRRGGAQMKCAEA